MGHNSKIKIGKYYPFIRFKKHIFTKTAIFPPYAYCKLIISQDLNDREQCFAGILWGNFRSTNAKSKPPFRINS